MICGSTVVMGLTEHVVVGKSTNDTPVDVPWPPLPPVTRRRSGLRGRRATVRLRRSRMRRDERHVVDLLQERTLPQRRCPATERDWVCAAVAAPSAANAAASCRVSISRTFSARQP